MTKFTVNGREVDLDIAPDTSLLWALRDELRPTGTRFSCGACTVMLDGMPRRAGVAPISAIEGMAGPETAAMLAACGAIDVSQCGWCRSGQIMSATALLQQLPSPNDEDITDAMAGNVCRCATYVRIRQAIHDADRAQRRAEGAPAAGITVKAGVIAHAASGRSSGFGAMPISGRWG